MARKGDGFAGRTVVEAGFRSASHHPLVLGLALFLLVSYVFFPCLFALILSSSPVLLCTTLLLGILLSYGDPNPLGGEEVKRGHEVAFVKIGRPTGDVLVKKDESRVKEAVPMVEAVVATGTHRKERGGEEKRDFSGGKQAEGGNVLGVRTKDRKKTKSRKPEADASANGFDSSRGSPWRPINGGDASSDSESNGADLIPMLDEVHPLIDTDAPQPALKSLDNSDASSNGSSQDRDSDDGSALEEEEEEDDQQEDEEDEEAQGEKDDSNVEVVKWTAEDQKNLVDLGTSEMERNQRLENLIARRSARRSMIPELEGNLIDLDSSVPVPNMDEISRLQMHIAPISATRRNPFDIPFDSEESTGPVPGSAPSLVLPRKNPFDVPYDHHVDQTGSSAAAGGLSHQVFEPVPQRDPFFRRHESFTLGAFTGEFGREKRAGRLMPFFVADRVEQTGFPPLRRQSSDNSDSKVSSGHESDTTSSVIDQDNQKELLEEGMHRGGELLTPAYPDDEPVEEESGSSEDIDSVVADHEQRRTGIGAIHLNGSMIAEGTHQAADAFRSEQEELNMEEYDFSFSDAAKLEVIEDKYDDSDTSSSSEVNRSKHERSATLEPMAESSRISCDSMRSLPADFKILSRAEETVGGGQVAYPDYDSSPSAIDRALAEDLFHAGKRGLRSGSSLTDISDGDSPPRLFEKNISSSGDVEPTDEDLAFASGGLWVAAPSLASVDEIESRSREINEIREHDVIQVGIPVVNEDYAKPIKLAMQRSIGTRLMLPSSLSSVEDGSIQDS